MKFFKVSSRKNGKKVVMTIKANTADAAFNIAKVKHRVCLLYTSDAADECVNV